MVKRKILISVAVLIAMMLASVGVQASSGMTVTTDIFSGVCKVVARFDAGADKPASLEIIPSTLDKSELNTSNNDLQDALKLITYADQNNCNSDGTVSFSFKLSSSDTYLIRVRSMKSGEAILTETVDYISLGDIENIWNNLILNPYDNLSKFLEIFEVKDETLLSMSKDDVLMNAISSYDSLGEYNKDNVDAFILKVKSESNNISFLRSVLSEIKSANNTTEINTIVNNIEKASILGITEYLERYNALKNTVVADNAVLGKTYTTAAAFKSDFIAAIEAAEKSQEDNSPSYNPPSFSPGGVGGGSLGSSVSAPSVIPSVSQDTHSFTDISNVSWATEAIVALYNEGIISGKSKHEFAPNDNITREEFVKIALGVMGVEPASGTVAFSDVDASSWYAPYVNAALSAGIVSGYSDTQFGVGEYITRQDVAVILNRVHSLSSANVSMSFSDSNDISDYAKSAVEKLSAAGIINGSDGKFMPKSNCTRAEAACMVYKMMSLMKEGK